MELAGVAVAREHDPRAVGRPARAVALIPARAVGESRDSTPVRIHDVDLFVALLAVALEQDLRAVGGPGGRKITEGVVGKSGDTAPVQVEDEDLLIFVAAVSERDPRPVGRPSTGKPALGGELGFSRPVHVDGKDFGAAGAEARERDPLAVRSPDRIDVSTRTVGDPGDVGPVRVHHVDLEVTVAGAVEGDQALELTRDGAELRSRDHRGEGPGGLPTTSEPSPNDDERQQSSHRLQSLGRIASVASATGSLW